MADANESQMQAQIDDAAAWADPLFPLTSRAVRRCVAAAESLGLACVPQLYNVAVPQPFGISTSTLQWQPTKTTGPVCIVHVDLPEDHAAARIIPRVNAEQFCDGSIIQGDAWEYPRRYNGTMMESPIPVDAQANVNFEMSHAGDTYDEGEGATFYTLAVRAKLRANRQLCEVPNDVAAEWLRRVRNDGVFWGTSVRWRSTPEGTTEGPISGDVIVETMVVAEKRATIEGEGNSINTQIRVTPTILTPINGPLFGRRFDGDRALVQAGLRWPVPGSSNLEVQCVFAASTATPVPVRATLLGRRGGIVGGCIQRTALL